MAYQPSGYGEPASHNHPAYGSQASSGPILMGSDFLDRVEAVRSDIERLSSSISQIASLHQRAIVSTDGGSSVALESMVAQTQVLNTRIKDQIKYLERDAARSGGNSTKDSQVRSLKNQFRSRLEQYQQEEVLYKKRYQEQIARQYRIVNPNADEEEVREAMTADWGDEGVFQTAVSSNSNLSSQLTYAYNPSLQLRSNRTGAAASVLGEVRSRHNDIQHIEQTLIELNQLFQDLAEAILIQDPVVTNLEQETVKVADDTKLANVELGKGVKSARKARKLKWWCCGLMFLILVAVVVILVIKFKPKPKQEGQGTATPPPKPTSSAA
jgi:syntaxin 1B/2/3